jgi:hypothetical protein
VEKGMIKERNERGEGGATVICLAQPTRMAAHSLYPLILERLKYLYLNNYNTHPVLTISSIFLYEQRTETPPSQLRLDASFAMAPHVLRPDLDRAKSAPDFEAQTDQTCLPRF